MKRIKTQEELCTGCKLCQMFCSSFNFKVNIHKMTRIGIKPEFPEGIFRIQLCNQCDICRTVCPVEAIYVDEKGAYIIDPEKCTNCGLCVESCPQHAIFTHPEINYPFMCNLCGECIPNCPTHAIAWEEV